MLTRVAPSLSHRDTRSLRGQDRDKSSHGHPPRTVSSPIWAATLLVGVFLERDNGILQSFGTNFIFGRLEGTLMRKWCNASLIIARMTNSNFAHLLEPLREWAEDLLGNRYSGMLTKENELASAMQTIPGPIGRHRPSEAVVTRWPAGMGHATQLVSLSTFTVGPATYASKSELAAVGIVGNCIVYVKLDGPSTAQPSSTQARLHPAMIQELVSIQKGDTFTDIHALVHVFKDLNSRDCLNDKFRHPRWEPLQAQMRYRVVEPIPRLIPVENIVCHAARCEYRAHDKRNEMSRPAFIFIGLDRVSPSDSLLWFYI
ncbi:hypothetical protein BKA62DRAFT_822364 [Auriculariales sp. MPI-PUGE-AT-0066]|nr:hypothetical protein BKA62DRAFT_822364 [Auriculariales sp. MPI-PUGE-AT-0066]